MKIISALALLFCAIYVNAQEEVLLFDYIPASTQETSVLKSAGSAVLPTFLQLPFYEDFASNSSFPDSKRWIDSSVYINNCFATKPPNIGVASFDALNKDGRLHSNASSSSFFADTLTSRPIALAGISAQKNKPADSIAISFYYQRGALGNHDNTPDESDSLHLEMYYPSSRYGIFINEVSSEGIEIYNGSFFPISLANCSIVIGTDTARYVFTTTNLHSDSLAPYYHAVLRPAMLKNTVISFKVNSGDTLFLKAADNKYSDSIIYNNTTPLFNSYGREIDGSERLVEFSVPTLGQTNGNWVQEWSLGGNKANPIGNDAFSYHRIFFTNQSKIVNGFRFRFYNSASLSNDPSHARNADFFHIDQIYIDSRKGDILDYPDVAFASPLSSFLREYTSVPYRHLESRGSINDVSTFFFNINNFSNKLRTVKYYITIQKLFDSQQITTQQMYDAGIPAHSKISDTLNIRQFINPFDTFLEDTEVRDEASYSVKMYFADDNSDMHAPYRFNDTLRYTQKFSDYYAYDDGSSEAGYGVRGENSMAVSQKFKLYQKDTLHAVSIFFNPTLNDPDMVAKRFFLAIWADNAGRPGELLYRSPSIESVNNKLSGINTFQTIQIAPDGIISNEEYLVVSGDIHIGWMQTTNFLMSVGVDLNRTTTNKVYYQFGEKWTLAQIKYPLMIRPHLGHNISTTAKEIVRESDTESLLYPNPAQNSIYFTNKNADFAEIYSLQGIKIFSTKVVANTVDISIIPEGTYLLNLRKNNSSIQSEILFIQR